MTDLEITRLCGRAMQLDLVQRTARRGDGYWSGVLLKNYDPLHDDAQAMALVKKFKIHISYRESTDAFSARIFIDGDKTDSSAKSDLNRAICECCARVQAAK